MIEAASAPITRPTDLISEFEADCLTRGITTETTRRYLSSLKYLINTWKITALISLMLIGIFLGTLSITSALSEK